MHTLLRHCRLLPVAAALATVAALVTITGPGPSAAAATALVRTVTYQGQTLTLRLAPVAIHAPSYEVLVQQADGTLDPVVGSAERAYLGSVDGKPDAMASGIVASDGSFLGQVVFDRGGSWFIKDNAVTGTRGLTQPTTYAWPSSGEAKRNVTTAPGQVGSTSYRWDIGYDVDNGWFTSAPVSGSIAKALDYIDLAVISMFDVYESNALLRPAVGRVIIRGSLVSDPYVDKNQGQRLGVVGTEWGTTHPGSGVDDVAMLTSRDAGSGVAYLSSAGNPGYSVNGGSGLSLAVQRHELGHTWGAYDNHTNGPEGATINSGNSFHRFDGTELSAMMRYRNSKVAKFTSAGTFGIALPPYAALDLVDDLDAGVPFSFRPAANDHDANGDALAMRSVAGTSHLGGTVTRSGDVVTYRPPAVAERSVDWVRYVVQDATGKTATGVALFRVDPYVAPPAASTWPVRAPVAGTVYQLTNKQSALKAAIPVGSTGKQALIQRAGTDTRAQWKFSRNGAGFKMGSPATGQCAGVEAGKLSVGARILHGTCTGKPEQQWKVVENPTGGRALVNVKSGLCLAVKGSSVLSGAGLVQANCGLSSSQVWDVGFLPMSKWAPAALPSSGSRELVNALSGLHVGTAAGASWSAKFVQKAPGAQSALTFLANADGTWRVRQTASGKCFNDEAATHTYVVLWDCNEGTAGAKVRALSHPLGGVVLVGVLADECIGVEGASTLADASLIMDPCVASSETQRWKVALSPG